MYILHLEGYLKLLLSYTEIVVEDNKDLQKTLSKVNQSPGLLNKIKMRTIDTHIS
jgi:hypothetical protein